jgi:hypothetical protein
MRSGKSNAAMELPGKGGTVGRLATKAFVKQSEQVGNVDALGDILPQFLDERIG